MFPFNYMHYTLRTEKWTLTSKTMFFFNNENWRHTLLLVDSNDQKNPTFQRSIMTYKYLDNNIDTLKAFRLYQ